MLNIRLAILFSAALIYPIGARDSRRAPEDGKPPMFVLQVGVSNYKYHRKLSGVADVLAMRALLAGDAYKIPRENIVTLCDAGAVKECDGAATKDNIVREFETHLIKNAREYNKKTGKQAIILFEFSGHGSQTPDLDGDERDDHLDETLVTVDSQDEPGKNFDITDDEIYQLNSRLAPYTNNIIYILDNCTSGSGTRDAEQSGVRGLPPRKTVPVPMKLATTDAASRGAADKKTAEDDAETDMLPPSSGYIVLAAARAGELAQQKDIFECDTCPKKLGTYGYLTFYLLRELESATAATSWRDVMDNVARSISADTSGTQNAQIEGNADLRVFGELSRVKNPGIVISKVAGKQITVRAGAMQGVAVGTILDIYSVEDEKIAAAKVSRVLSANESAADIIASDAGENSPSAARAVSIEKRDRAVLGAPDLGAMRLNVLLDGEDAAKLTGDDKKLIEILRARLKPARGETATAGGVAIASGKWRDAAARWDAALLKDRFDKVFADRSRASVSAGESASAADRQVFYLAGRDFTPLYGFYVSADEPDAAERIEKAIAHVARIRSLKAVANGKSKLKGTVTITPLAPESLRCKSEELTVDSAAPLVRRSGGGANYKLEAKRFFGLEIANNSPRDLYIVLLDAGTDGSVKIFAPRRVAEEQNGLLLKAGARKTLFGDGCRAWIAALPSGVETFKVIASTEPITRRDLEFLEMNAIGGDREGGKSLATIADWTTAETSFEVVSAPNKKPQ